MLCIIKMFTYIIIIILAKDLISNLLAVDPEKRYTINQFFEHPWVKDEVICHKYHTSH